MIGSGSDTPMRGSHPRRSASTSTRTLENRACAACVSIDGRSMPASAAAHASALRSPSANGTRSASAARWPATRCSSATSAANAGIDASPSHTAMASRPPGRRTRRISRIAARRSWKNISPNWLTTASKDPLGNGSVSAAPSRHAIVDERSRATASMPGSRSSPTTSPPAPARASASRASTPVPQATSRTRSPAAIAAASATIGAKAPVMEATNSAS